MMDKDFMRIAKTKNELLGCVDQVELRESERLGGYLVCKTTGSGNLWVNIPRSQFELMARYLRNQQEDLDNDLFTVRDAKRIITWLRTRMIKFRCEVMLGIKGKIFYHCHMTDLMEGEWNHD